MMKWFRLKNREHKDDDIARGSYEPVVKTIDGLKHHAFAFRRLLKLAPMVGLLLGAGALMALHHFFYTHLNGKRIDPGSTELASFFQNQRNVNIIGTTIAHGARILLSLAIGVTFVQLFWEMLRSRSFSIAQIDALLRCSQSPYHFSALRAATASFALFAVSLAASATSLVVVLSPGSLKINSDFERTKSCAVPTVPPNVTGPGWVIPEGLEELESNLAGVTTLVMESNTYLPPFQANLSSICGSEVTSCSYNVTFAGPALDCIDITNETDFTVFNHPEGLPPNQLNEIWEIQFLDNIGITILSRDLEKGLSQANNCTAYNATYFVGVNLREDSATLDVWDVTLDLDSVLSNMDENNVLSTCAQMFFELLPGLCHAGPKMPTSDCSGISFFVTTPTGNSTFSDTVPHFTMSAMQNLTLSLLSGAISFGYGDDPTNNLHNVPSTCSSIVAVYVYSGRRLLATYGIALALSTVVAAYGCSLILRNGVERKFSPSQLVKISLNRDMVIRNRDTGNNFARGGTEIQLIRTGNDKTSQSLVPTSTNSQSFSTLSDLGPHPLRPTLFTTTHLKMLLLLILSAGCMIFNHAYNHYLDGKSPSTSLYSSNFSDLALDQSIASDVGIAIAYAGQTFLAIAIGFSCAQLFWHTLRRRNKGHTISQVDALAITNSSPFSLSLFHAFRASASLPLLALLAASTSLISIAAPTSMKVIPGQNHVKDCTVLALRNLSALSTNASLYVEFEGNANLLTTVAKLGTYLAPIDTCGAEPLSSYCSYDLEFVGPGFECKDVTESSNYTAFATSSGPNETVVYLGEISPQNSSDLWPLSVQTWDVERSVYQNISCIGALRSYAISVSRTAPAASVISVTESRLVSPVHFDVNHPESFVENYLSDMMHNSEGHDFFGTNETLVDIDWNFSSGGIGTKAPNGSITWNQNMTNALESFAQNATLSMLSGQTVTFDLDTPYILENVTTTCTYTFTAYEYSPRHLFLTYGAGIIVTVICTLGGLVAIRKNGVEESMDFSRFLRAILNERMYNAREQLNEDTIIKSDETAEGAFIPLDL